MRFRYDSILALSLSACGLAGALLACTTQPDVAAPAGTQTSSGPTGGGGTSSGPSGGGANDGGHAGNGATGTLEDSFDGSGDLVGYTTNNANALPDVKRADGRYRANLVDNTNDVTLHYHDAQGRLDAKLVSFPFEVIVRNIGIGTPGDSQTAPPPTNNPYIFAGVQVHVENLDTRTSAHVVVGHRGETHFTIEGKTTNNGSSQVNDDGANVLPAGRADIRVVGKADRTIQISWQPPNPSPGSTADDWHLYGGTGTLPGEAPAFGERVYVGLITYAFGYAGIPFVGTCDAIETP